MVILSLSFLFLYVVKYGHAFVPSTALPIEPPSKAIKVTFKSLPPPFNPILSNFVSSRLFSTATKNDVQREEKKKTSINDNLEGLSEIDARVLQEILEDNNKLSLEEEENMKKLLERGIRKEATETNNIPRSDTDSNKTSEYSSTLLKTFENNEMWASLKRKTADLIDSAKILVENRVKRDAVLVAALGTFFWERAVQDIGRALPAAATVSKKAVTLLMLSNTTSASDMMSKQEITSAPVVDEILQVGSSIKNIVSGEASGMKNNGFAAKRQRGLKTVAPAGQDGYDERLRRAYKRRKIEIEESQDVAKVSTKATGGVFDTVYQVQRDLKAETNQPGYKTENVRKVIAAGAANTGRLLSGVKNGFMLAAEKRNKRERVLQLQQANTETKAKEKKMYMIEITDKLKGERSQLIARFNKCIGIPEDTWLRPEFIPMSNDEESFVEDGLRDLVKSMVQCRDVIEALDDTAQTRTAATSEDESFYDVLCQLQIIKNDIDELVQEAENSVSLEASEAFRDIVYGDPGNKDENDSDIFAPILNHLDRIERIAFGDEMIEEEQMIDPFNLEFSKSEGSLLEDADVIEVSPTEIFEDLGSSSGSVAGTERTNEGGNFFFSSFERLVQGATKNARNEPDNSFETRIANDKYDLKQEMASADGQYFADVIAEPVEVIPTAAIMDAQVEAKSDIKRVETAMDADVQDIIVDTTYDATFNKIDGVGSDTELETNPFSEYDDEEFSSVSSVEIISDDDFNNAVGREAKEVKQVSDEAIEAESLANEKNLVVEVLLRSFDIVFLILEKVLVAVPVAMEKGQLATQRYGDVNRAGLGSKGWKTFKNSNRGANKY